MAFQFSRLKSQLVQSKLQQQNPTLYQVIDQLIQFLAKFQSTTDTVISGGGGGTVDTGIRNSDLLTWSDESPLLPNSRELKAGTNVSFDDSVAKERTINVAGTGGSDWDVLTNGDSVNPELIFADGDVIMLELV